MQSFLESTCFRRRLGPRPKKGFFKNLAIFFYQRDIFNFVWPLMKKAYIYIYCLLIYKGNKTPEYAEYKTLKIKTADKKWLRYIGRRAPCQNIFYK